MDKLDAMQAFAKVVALGSYAEAGRQLGLTRSAVSKGVMELEQILGARLLDRTTRRVSPTEAGLAYYERCVDILARIDETEQQVSRLHDEPRGVLKVNAPMSFGALYLGDAIADFMESYPELKVELTLNDRFIDPIEEGADITIRIAVLQDFEPDCEEARARTPPAGGITGLPCEAWKADGAGGFGVPPVSDVRPHHRTAAMATDDERR